MGGLPLVVGTGDRLEGLLPGSIPNLNLNVVVADLDGLGAELDTQSGLMLYLVSALGEAQENAGLADV